MEVLYDYSEPVARTALNRICTLRLADVPPLLRPYVDSIFVNRPHPNTRELSLSRAPEGIVHVVCDILDFSRAGHQTFVNDARLFVSGAHETVHPMPFDVRETIVAQLRPGAGRALLGIPCDSITGRLVRLEDIWGAAARLMLEEIAAQRTSRARLQVFIDWLCARLGASADDRFVIQAAQAVGAMPAELGTKQLAAKLGYTERHLLRRFREDLGLSPKSFARVTRFNAVLRALPPESGWAEIAASHGFCDQSHLIREFRQLLGETPAEFARAVSMLELLRFGVIVRTRSAPLREVEAQNFGAARPVTALMASSSAVPSRRHG